MEYKDWLLHNFPVDVIYEVRVAAAVDKVSMRQWMIDSTETALAVRRRAKLAGKVGYEHQD